MPNPKTVFKINALKFGSILLTIIFAISHNRPKNHFWKLMTNFWQFYLWTLSPNHFGLSTPRDCPHSLSASSGLFNINTSFTANSIIFLKYSLYHCPY